MAYNLVRRVTAQAAARHGLAPRAVSFTGALQTLAAFRPLLEYRDLLYAIAPTSSRVGWTGTIRG